MHTPQADTRPTELLGVQLIIYDLDGTLVDAFEDIRRCANRTLVSYGLAPITLEQTRSYIGNASRKFVERALGPENAHLLDEAYARYVGHYTRHPAEAVRTYPGVEATLERIRARGLRQAVLTNKLQHITEAICRKTGLADWFDGIWGDDGHTPHKPHPDAIGRLLDHFGLAPGQCLMVGDGRPDHEVARAVGMPVAGATWGMLTREQIEALEPDFLLENITQLPGLLPSRNIEL